MRLIDASDVKKRGDCYLPDVRKTIAYILSHTKTVKDAVVIVRCKDCKWWKREENQDGEIGDDYFCAFDQNKSYREDFYCADGERRKEPEKETKTDHWGYERLFCPNCKAQYTKGQRFCDNCGQKLI